MTIRIELNDTRLGDIDITATTPTLAQSEVTRLLERCIAEYGTEPPVWEKRRDEPATRVEDPRGIDFDEVTEVLFQPRMLGGG